MSYNNNNNDQNHKRFYSKNKNRHHTARKPHWIYSGDLCWFDETQRAFSADVSENGTWSFTESIERVLYSDEPLVYARRTRLQDGTVVHYFRSLGLEYAFLGSINAFNKRGPVRRPETWE